ncbi:hypothetical protein A2Z22_01545 [Candidatus Woesebacteria bacterium RBG_16_34_12]|uniref:SCP domain-containing protein n=1 Tax=Candidatus Woesebacteria bacterium RBG_16_34_12 TaxID=1802480 RepID=A0A1F7XA35_9BACT|nr:MAG: hypothetical protein A2Z22_01545 [Candidatus Woesebacteria bacterium RBG_16_34_12]
MKAKIFWKQVVIILIKVYSLSLTVALAIYVFQAVYRLGYSIGFNNAQKNADEYYLSLIKDLREERIQIETNPAIVTKKEIDFIPSPTSKPNFIRDVNWGGPDLWEAVNKRRQEFGVNPLKQADELCTVASLRLNELLELGKLDGHEGFSNLEERRQDLSWIFEKYSNLAEFLLAGADSASEAVSLWENTLGHKQLLTGGEYVWGCIYAQNSFAVAITAF